MHEGRLFIAAQEKYFERLFFMVFSFYVPRIAGDNGEPFSCSAYTPVPQKKSMKKPETDCSQPSAM
jgi:hypothetical protein